MNIGIVSLGLIGGSLLKKLAQTEEKIFAYTRNQKTIEEAITYTPYVSSDMSILKDCDIVFVASPINKTLEVLDLLENIVSKDCIVLDCASVKEFVMKKERPYKFIGSHPMAGTEFSGFEHSFAELFEGAKWVLTPSLNTPKSDIDVVEQIILKTGAQVVIADAKEHDRAVALISHMPLILSQALFNCVKDNELALKLASSGFRDMTRLATSNLEMACDMKDFNNQNIAESIEKFSVSLDEIFKTKDIQKLSDIKNRRKSMYSTEGKNIF